MKIILVAPSGAVESALSQLELDRASDQVIVVSRVMPDTEVTSIRVTPSWQGMTKWAESMLGRSVVGRNIQRLTPLDAGRRFAAATRRSTPLRDHAASADLIIVLERDGILSGWQIVRRWAPDRTHAVYGVPPGRAIIAAERG